MMTRSRRMLRWLSLEKMQELYKFFGPLTDEDCRMLSLISEGQRNRWFQAIYGKHTARLAREEYRVWAKRRG